MLHKILLVFVYLITIFYGLHLNLNKRVTQMIQIKNYGISLDGIK